MMYSNSKLNYSVRSRMHAYIPTPIRAPHSHFDIKDHHIIEPRWVCFLFILSILLAAHSRDYIFTSFHLPLHEQEFLNC